MKTSRVYLAPIENPFPDAIGVVARVIERELDVEVASAPAPVDVSAAFHPSRRQYSSSMLLERLIEVIPDASGAKIVGITDVDLFIPVLTFVFGEAQLDGVAAIASSHRLRNSFYGLPADHDLLLERLSKECLHELGHTLGLVHCDDYRCVMCASTAVEEIDLKADRFCPTCRAAVAAVESGAK